MSLEKPMRLKVGIPLVLCSPFGIVIGDVVFSLDLNAR
jgi:hypothetical protein